MDLILGLLSWGGRHVSTGAQKGQTAVFSTAFTGKWGLLYILRIHILERLRKSYTLGL